MHALGMDAPHALKMIEEESIWREKYGTLQLQHFDGWWLKDFPHIIDHLESEHLLHIRGVDEEGRGLHWQTNKFSWKLNPQFNPEAKIGDASRGGLQMKMGYFIVPPAKIEKFTSLSLSPHILKELEVKDQKGELLGYRFFVHPEAYVHYRSLHDADISFIKPEASTFMGTPTSSYRSWVIRQISDTEPKSIPFIVKLGVASTNTDTSRLLPKNDIQRSIQSQVEFDKMDKKSFNPSLLGSELLIFPENLGLILKDIPHYPPIPASDSGEPVDSGLIIREFPQELLEGKCKILSFSSLMSVERMKKENQGICALNHEEKSFACLPLIYEVIAATINKGLAKNSEEFFHTFLIQGYLQAMEFFSFHMGRSFSPHGQNLCLVLNQDNTPRGFAYRDHEGIFPDKEKGYIETFSWFYRYHVFVKLLNVIAQVGKDRLPHPPGAPTQVGYRKKLPERNLHHYLFRKCQEEHQEKALQILHSFGISFKQYYTLLGLLDADYLIYLSRYFDVAKAGIEYNFLPAAESRSSDENCLIELNRKLWKHHYLTENKGLQ